MERKAELEYEVKAAKWEGEHIGSMCVCVCVCAKRM